MPLLLAVLFAGRRWRRVFVVMMATMLVDIDHLLAEPIYDPGRCSINFHPLHTFVPIAFYGLICFLPRLRWIGLGLLVHMALDSFDCYQQSGIWFTGTFPW